MVLKRKLKLVVHNEQPRKSGKWQGTDAVFFHRSQIAIGTRFVNHGRLDHGSIWEVTDIRQYSKTGRKLPSSGEVKSLNDQIILVRVGSNQTKQMSFQYMSYSALWRLV